MNTQHILRSLLATAVLVLFVSCGMFGPDETPLTVEQVDDVSLSRTASTEDFGTLSSEADTPETLAEALDLLPFLLEGMDDGSMNTSVMSSANGNDPFQEWLDEHNFTYIDEDNRFLLQGTATDTVNLGAEDPFEDGVIEVVLSLDLSVESEETDSSFSLDTQNSGSFELDITEVIRAENPDDDWVELDGYFAAAANLNAALESEMSEHEVEFVRLAYSAAFEVSAAATIEGKIGGEHRGANMLLTVSYGDNIFVEADNFEAFEQALFDRIDDSEYVVTLAVYDSDGELKNEWNITVDTLEEVSSSANFAVRANEAILDRSR